MSLTEAGTEGVARASTNIGWRLTTAEYGLLKTSMVIQQLRQSAVHMEHMARLEPSNLLRWLPSV